MDAPAAVVTDPVPDNLPDGQPEVSELVLSEPGVCDVTTLLLSRLSVNACLVTVYRQVTLMPKSSACTSQEKWNKLKNHDRKLGSDPVNPPY